MIQRRRKEDIYLIEGGFFTGRWHFSFDRYYDPENNEFGTLRVLNDDTFKPGAVWPLHPHREMEILTYTVEGVFRHDDDLGNADTVKAGGIHYQRIGTGLSHSVVNVSKTRPVRILRIWIQPIRRGLPPAVAWKQFTRKDRTNRLLPLVSNTAKGAIIMNGDATLYACALENSKAIEHPLARGRGAYIYNLKGSITLNDVPLGEGDAAKVWSEKALAIKALQDADFVLIDVKR